jgi:hypothetical protein
LKKKQEYENEKLKLGSASKRVILVQNYEEINLEKGSATKEQGDRTKSEKRRTNVCIRERTNRAEDSQRIRKKE